MDTIRRFGICPLCDETRNNILVTIYPRKGRDLTGYICTNCATRLSNNQDDYFYVDIHRKTEIKNDINKSNLV